MQEGSFEWYKAIFNSILKDDMRIYQNQYDMYQLLLNLRNDFDFEKNPEIRNYSMKLSKYTHQMANYMALNTGRADHNDLFWKTMLFQSHYDFVSYVKYMEKNRRPEKRFYEPREKTLHIVADELQALEERKYDFLGISLPPRIGKALAFDTPVLTKNGWKRHVDLKVGDEVKDIYGEWQKVIAVHPPCRMEYKVVFDDGEEIICHGNHEWVLKTGKSFPWSVRETKTIKEYIKYRKIYLPDGSLIASVEPIEEAVYGNCITVKGGTYCVGKTMKPTHNSTICIFFLTWVMGKRPDEHNAMSGHSGILADGFYSEALNLITTTEYTFNEIFPNVKMDRKSAEKKEINLGSPDRFSTLTCRGIDGTFTGAVDISSGGYLYVDDIIRDRTESLSPIRLENRFQDYLNVLVDRKNDGARELMVGTRWNLYDPLGKLEKMYRDNERYKFLKIPALDENDESNFNYLYGKGFSTAYYIDMREKLDPNEWKAKFQQDPFLREGIMFPEDTLRTYNGVLPEGGFVANISVVDVAWGGGDSLSMPIGALYENGDVYIYDWVFNKGKKEDTLPIVSGRIIGNNIQSINFEANNGGEMYAYYISERLKERKYVCSVTDTKAPTKMAKKEKINQYAGNIINDFVFLDRKHRNQEYKDAMDELCTFTYIGDNPHDDAPDSLAQLAARLNKRPAPPPQILDRRF